MTEQSAAADDAPSTASRKVTGAGGQGRTVAGPVSSARTASAARAEVAGVITGWTPIARAAASSGRAPSAEAIEATRLKPARQETSRTASTPGRKTARPATTRLTTTRPETARRVTARGAILVLLGLFLLCLLMATWLGVGILPGLGYMVGCVIAPSLVSRRGLLQVVAAPPALFFAALVISQVVTAQGSSRHGRALSVVEGTVLTLAATAPWLLLGTALGVANGLRLGLIERVGELRADLRLERAQRSEPGAGA